MIEYKTDQHEGAKITSYVSFVLCLINGCSGGNHWLSLILFVVFMASLFAQG